MPAPNDVYDESDTDVSDTELMPYQQKAMASPKKEVDAAETKVCKVDCAVQTEREAVGSVDPSDKRQNQVSSWQSSDVFHISPITQYSWGLPSSFEEGRLPYSRKWWHGK